MGLFSKFRRRKSPYAATTDEERIARYVYLLNTLPASVIERAHASAFRELPPERRREMFDQLRPFMTDSERDAATDDPSVLARLVRRAEERRARRDGGTTSAGSVAVDTRTDDGPAEPDPREMLLRTGAMALVANQFLVSSAVAAYFTVGAGSLALAAEPAWVGDTYDPGGSGDGGAAGGGFDGSGGGYDGGVFGGGFDGGGFGGGFDGGGMGGM